MTLLSRFGWKQPSGTHHRQVLEANDRRGERAIALAQCVIALIVFGFHILSAAKSAWHTFSPLTVTIAGVIVIACAIRFSLSKWEVLPNGWLNILSVVDGILIFLLITSYSYAYSLPIESAFKAPSLVFLMVYTCVRALKLDPLPVMVSGSTVLVGWTILHFMAVATGGAFTESYPEYVMTGKIMVGANIEIALGYAATVLILTFATAYARSILSETADLKELAAARTESEDIAARFGAIFDSSTDGILVVDQNGVIEQVNPALVEMFGHEAHDLIGNTATVLMSSENAEKLATDVAMFRDSGRSQLIGRPFESEGLTRHGKTFPIELSISHFKVGDVVRFTGIIRDISDRMRTIESERAARAKYEDVVTSALDAIIVINEQGNVVEFNPAAEEIFGYTKDDIINKEMAAMIVPSQHREAHRAGMKHFLATGEGPVLNQRIEIDAMTADNRSIMIELAIKESIGPKGRLFFGYVRDITDKKAAETALLEAKERAEVANRAKASFLAMMSHEIRTPLNGVLGVLTLLADNVSKPENVNLIKTARRSGKALLAIINDILDFSKLEAGRLDLEIGSFHTDVLLDSIASLVRHQSETKGLVISFSTAPEVPEILLGDQDRIRQILLNLVWNAIKFTDQGYVRVGLTNVAQDDVHKIRFEVQDSGIGVPDDRADELFTEFATIDASYARKFGGTGLGLSICKALTEAMDGEIGYLKNTDQGSTFWFELPLQPGDPTKVFEEDTEESARYALEGLNNIRILLAEDNATNQLVVGNMLERLGCVVDTVSNGKEAVEGIASRGYDIILMDVSMPEMDGITATRKIRAMKGEVSKVPIIALTAFALDEDRQKVLAAGMDDFVAKPVSRLELARVLARQMNGQAGEESSVDSDQSDNTALFDENTLAAVFADIDTELQQRIVKEFKKDVSRHLGNLRDAESGRDQDEFDKATHGLKGVAGTFGASELARLSGQANTLIRQGKPDAAFAMTEEVENMALAVLQSVDKRFSLTGA
ncbi:MAG: PAS domain S-box protein [Rhizobiaceae bacterium]